MMSCPAVFTDNDFLSSVLANIDCQAQLIGSYGYLALGQPGSPASLLVAGLLTLFVALFGLRLMFGPAPGVRDLVYDVLKIGIVLTLAFSWPAFRTVIYDVTLEGPAEVTSVIIASSQPSAGESMVARLQAADDKLVELVATGTGRNSSQFITPESAGSNFAGTALQDDAAFGSARLLYLAGTIGPLALLRIAAALLLALAPLVAALFFFNQSRGIFAGWIKGLVFTFAGSIGTTIVLTVQLAMLEPMLADALNVRNLGYATPSAPTELFAIMLAFVVVHLAMLAVIARIVFYRGWTSVPEIPRAHFQPAEPQPAFARPAATARPPILRAERISTAIEQTIRRETRDHSERSLRETTIAQTSQDKALPAHAAQQRLGSSFRRPVTKPLQSTLKRDRRT